MKISLKKFENIRIAFSNILNKEKEHSNKIKKINILNKIQKKNLFEYIIIVTICI